MPLMFLTKSTSSPRALKNDMMLRGRLTKLLCVDEWSIAGSECIQKRIDQACGRELAKPACFDEWPITGSNAFDAQKRMYQACGWSDVGRVPLMRSLRALMNNGQPQATATTYFLRDHSAL